MRPKETYLTIKTNFSSGSRLFLSEQEAESIPAKDVGAGVGSRSRQNNHSGGY